MPLYEYVCTKCNKHFDKMQSFSDESVHDCPYCKTEGSVHRVFSEPAVIFRGSGFYCTDHAKSGGSVCQNCGHNHN